MIRLYQNVGQQVMLALIALREILDREGQTANTNTLLIQAGTNFYNAAPGGIDPGAHAAVYDAMTSLTQKDLPTLPETIELVGKQLYSKRRGRNDVDLIDTIVRALGLPYISNRLSGTMLREIKEHLMIAPADATALAKALREELRCAQCMHIFVDGEMSTYARGDQGVARFFCHKCVRPKVICCDKCGKGAPLSRHMAGVHAKAKEVDCGCTTAEKKAEEGPTPLAPDLTFVYTGPTIPVDIETAGRTPAPPAPARDANWVRQAMLADQLAFQRTVTAPETALDQRRRNRLAELTFNAGNLMTDDEGPF